MNTFLPYPDFKRSAQCLDSQRLHSQINEGLVIMRTLTGYYLERGKKGWPHHPATKLWEGHVVALGLYCLACLNEYEIRMDKVYPSRHKSILEVMRGDDTMPSWLGDEEFHSSHRAALLAKDPEWYSQFGWAEKPGIKYVWPSVLNRKGIT